MSFVMVRIEVPAMDESQLNDKVLGSQSGDNTKPQEGVNALRNLMDAINAGSIDAQVDVAIRATTQSITASGAGSSAQYNLK